jgi:hypothetical protein
MRASLVVKRQSDLVRWALRSCLWHSPKRRPSKTSSIAVDASASMREIHDKQQDDAPEIRPDSPLLDLSDAASKT